MKKGFTLIELIIVIVLLGIVSGLGAALFSVVFRGYTDTATKDFLFAESKFIIERIDREIRSSIPNTVRLHNSNQAIQFGKFSSASYYEELTQKDKIGIPESGILSVGSKISIYNTNDSHFYNNIRIYKVIDNSSDNVTLDKNISKNSPYLRFFKVDTPVTIYKSGNFIKICFGYQIDNTIDGIDDGSCSVMGSFVDSVNFDYQPGDTQRNAIVNIDLRLKKGDTQIIQKHQVHIRNTP